MDATPLEVDDDLYAVPDGVYIVRSDHPQYFSAVALTVTGEAKLLGERYEDADVEVLKALTLKLGEGRTRRANPTISIGREFFVTALKDYSDWKQKWWREAIQNAVDAGGKHITLGCRKNADGTVTAWCEDDGKGMDEDTLLTKFLVLGGTTKTTESGAAGGFGKAKELLVLPWLAWKIHSRGMIATGAGIDYATERGEHLNGTRIEIVMPADNYTYNAPARAFVEKCDLPGIKFTLEWNMGGEDTGTEQIKAAMKAGELIDEVPGKLTVHFKKGKFTQRYAFVRTKGIFMFEQYITTMPGYLIAEIIAPSVEILTANRDGFRDPEVRQALNELGESIAKDNMSALAKKRGLVREKFKGSGKFRALEREAEVLAKLSGAPEDVAEDLAEAISPYQEGYLPTVKQARVMMSGDFLGPDHIAAAAKQLVWEPDFYLINDIEGFRVPRKFYPETMGGRINKLAKTWTELCRYVLIQLGCKFSFGVGFHFSEDALASCLKEIGESWLMLNPFTDLHKRTEIWNPSKVADLKWLYSAAIHECTHMADGLNYHDESFAAALTHNFAKCADGFKHIKKIVAAVRMAGSAEADVLHPGAPEPEDEPDELEDTGEEDGSGL